MTDAEKVTVPAITVGDAVVVCAVFVFVVIIRALAHCEAALRVVVQHHDELRSIVGLAVKRLVRDDNRGSRQSGRRDAVEHILRNGDTVQRVLGIVAAIDRDRSPAQPPSLVRATAANTCVPMRLSGLRRKETIGTERRLPFYALRSINFAARVGWGRDSRSQLLSCRRYRRLVWTWHNASMITRTNSGAIGREADIVQTTTV